MRLALFAFIFATLAISATAVVLPLKSVIVSYPDTTPEKVVAEAKSAIKAAGGIITHEYKLFKGFAARANTKALATVQTLGEQYNALIEEDKIMTVAADSS